MSFLNFSTYSQEPKSNVHKGTYSVVSTTGVNLREAPNLKSKILVKLPFATKIEITENKSFGIDTIGENILYRNRKEKIKNHIVGNWVKIKYKNYEGYLFDAYLGEIASLKNIVLDDSELDLNKNFILLFPGSYCHNNFWSVKNMNWLGLYQIGDHFEFKTIELSYSYFRDFIPDYMAIEDYTISTNNNENLMFIIGSKINLKKGFINGKRGKCLEGSNFEDFDKLQISGTAMYPELILKSKNKKQIINSAHRSITYYSPTCLVWEGDIDQDGKLDYIISYGEKSVRTYLYLSSEADDNQIVKPVAVFSDGYCC
ncbi:SH3 domain-containing protein [Aquimarina rubra]|uniref:SH3 domain-containing protein n=1 Tax=Aquimarina rubra TaxID=1920033 RepID=A0ABW5LAF4_9FLAO